MYIDIKDTRIGILFVSAYFGKKFMADDSQPFNK